MECLWCLFCHRQQAGHRHVQNQAVFYVCLGAYNGFPDHPVHGACLFPECPEIYDGDAPQSLVLSLTPRLSFYIKKGRTRGGTAHPDFQDYTYFFVRITITPFFPLSPYTAVAFSPFSTSMASICSGFNCSIFSLVAISPSITYKGFASSFSLI